jgi:DNA transformation protein
VDDSNKNKYLEEGSSPLVLFQNQKMVLSFFNVPPDIFENKDEFIE